MCDVLVFVAVASSPQQCPPVFLRGLCALTQELVKSESISAQLRSQQETVQSILNAFLRTQSLVLQRTQTSDKCATLLQVSIYFLVSLGLTLISRNQLSQLCVGECQFVAMFCDRISRFRIVVHCGSGISISTFHRAQFHVKIALVHCYPPKISWPYQNLNNFCIVNVHSSSPGNFAWISVRLSLNWGNLFRESMSG